jgi:hypothetical protein
MACFLCRNPVAPFGYEEPGFRSDRRDFRRIWACTDHRAEAEDRWAKCFNKRLDRAPSNAGVQSGPQGSFDL